MDNAPSVARRFARRLRSWEGLLLGVLLVVLLINTVLAPNYLLDQNQVNLWQNSIEKAIVVLAMAFVIINGEIDLSVASVMGLAAVVVAVLWENGVGIELAILVALLVGLVVGLFNGFWIAIVGLPSLVVTLATLIGCRGLATILIEDRSIGNAETAFPAWFEDLGQQPLSELLRFLGDIPYVRLAPFAMVLYVGLLIVAAVVLGASGFGRRTYVIGSSAAVARFSGVGVARHKLVIMTISSVTAALAGILLAAHLGAVRSSTAFGWELDIITIVLLGGVSIFGGVGHDAGGLPVDGPGAQHPERPGARERAWPHAERRRGAAAHPVRPAAEPHGDLPGARAAPGPGQAGDGRDEGRARGRLGVVRAPTHVTARSEAPNGVGDRLRPRAGLARGARLSGRLLHGTARWALEGPSGRDGQPIQSVPSADRASRRHGQPRDAASAGADGLDAGARRSTVPPHGTPGPAASWAHAAVRHRTAQAGARAIVERASGGWSHHVGWHPAPRAGGVRGSRSSNRRRSPCESQGLPSRSRPSWRPAH